MQTLRDLARRSSVRAAVVVGLTGAVIAGVFAGQIDAKTLEAGFLTAIGFYFGQQGSGGTSPPQKEN